MPMIDPASVICEALWRAMPKSVTLSRASFAFTCWSAETSTLCGLMSRWMIPCRWAKRSASRSCFSEEIAVPIGSAPRVMISSLRLRPSITSMAM